MPFAALYTAWLQIMPADTTGTLNAAIAGTARKQFPKISLAKCTYSSRLMSEVFYDNPFFIIPNRQAALRRQWFVISAVIRTMNTSLLHFPCSIATSARRSNQVCHLLLKAQATAATRPSQKMF
jgi:hypothetical protein